MIRLQPGAPDVDVYHSLLTSLVAVDVYHSPLTSLVVL